MDKKEYMQLYDKDGKLLGVFIPAHLWTQAEKFFNKPEPIGDAPDNKNLLEFETFLKSWDFPYKYDPSVQCAKCQTFSSDWRKSDDFKLHNANIGGLLVFHCKHCGATIMQKHFKDHRSVECFG